MAEQKKEKEIIDSAVSTDKETEESTQKPVSAEDIPEQENLTDTEEPTAPKADKTSEDEECQEEETPAEPEISETDKLKEALDEANNRNLRLIAEFDNYRRRTAKEQLCLIETANAKLLEKLSEVLDNFERAFDEKNKATDLSSFEKGMKLIHDQFEKILTDAGLEQIDPVGEKFDPNCQEALMKQASDTVPEDHIVAVFQKGCKIKNKTIKTAKVIVSSGKNKTPDASK